MSWYERIYSTSFFRKAVYRFAAYCKGHETDTKESIHQKKGGAFTFESESTEEQEEADGPGESSSTS